MKIKSFEIELSISELKEILEEGYIEKALSKTKKYLKRNEEDREKQIADIRQKISAILYTEDDSIVLWNKLHEIMPIGGKNDFTKKALKELKFYMDEDFLRFQKILDESYNELDDFFDISKYIKNIY